MVLLTPGPCMTSDRVRQAAALPDLNHRDPRFADLVSSVRRMLLDVVALDSGQWTSYLIGGSGTAAMEAMVASCIDLGPALILANGYYSERLDAIFKVHGIEHETLRFGWLEPWDMAEVEDRLRSRQYEAVLCAHHETTSGRLNPVGDLARLATEHGTRVLVDAISSFGADELDFENLDAVCTTSGKCLHGLPGVGIVLVRSPLRERMATIPRRTFYLSLPMYESDSPPLTPPIQLLQALRAALEEFFESGGWQMRHARYARQADRIRRALGPMGFGLAVPPDQASVALTVATLPPGWSYPEWFSACYDRGFELYGCKGELADRFFQVSTMGEVEDEHVEAWLTVVRNLIG